MNDIARLAYTIKEAAHASTLSQARLYELMAEGKLRYQLIGKRRLIPASALRELVGEAA